MIKFLKTIGYNFVNKPTLNNREFKLSLQTYSVDEDHSTFEKQVYDLEEQYELFLSTENYSEQKMRTILDKTRDLKLDDITMTIERQENGYIITFITTQRGK